jgi:tocopherol O-methyltransferase
MISCPSVEKRVIRTHYNLATPFYRLLWGRHIHHGLWEGSESPAEAQLKLTQTLSREAGLQGGERVLDVGCGMGGSSIYLAKTLGCHVTGITLSSVQRRWASVAARLNGVGGKTRFLATDAESVEFEPASFDAVWSVECTEHLFDKPAFFRRVAGWLRPGGRVAICAWQAGDGHLTADAERQVYDVCEGFFCPSLGSSEDYRGWFTDAGLHIDRYFDWTSRVAQTWEICERRARFTGVHLLARWIDKDQLMFLERFRTILRAYQSGAMTYGCWVATKPGGGPSDSTAATAATPLAATASA